MKDQMTPGNETYAHSSFPSSGSLKCCCSQTLPVTYLLILWGFPVERFLCLKSCPFF